MHPGSADDEPLVVRVPGPAGDVRVHVWPALGDPGRPVLLAFHGWTDGGLVFGALAEALGRRWTVVAPDAPAHGGTRWRPAPGGSGREEYRLDDQVGVGVAVLDALPALHGRRSPVVALGHSMGAIPAVGVAVARPDAVRHVVLEDPVRTAGRPRRRQTRRRRDVEALQALDLDARVALGRAEHPDWPDDELSLWARSKGEVDVAHLRLPADWGEPLAARLAGVRCPVTLVHGVPERGGIVSASSAGRMVRACRAGGQVLELDAGHNVRREARPAFVAALAAVLTEHAS